MALLAEIESSVRRFLAGCLLWSGAVGSIGLTDEPSLQRFEFEQTHMGTRFVVTCFADQRSTASQAADAAFARIAELDACLSDYRAESELNRLCRNAGSGEPQQVSDDLWQVLVAARRYSELTGGAFDVTVGPYVRLWRRARRNGKLPDAARLEAAGQRVGYRLLFLDEDQKCVRLTQTGMRLDLGGIAKGFAADEALEVLVEAGVRRAMVNAGGDIAVGAPPPDEPGWRIGLTGSSQKEDPEQFIVVSQCGVATSGDAFQFVEIDGIRYSHIVDPRTGEAVSLSSTVTVVAENCMAADALASAVSVLGPAEGVELINELSDVAAFVTFLQDGDVRTVESEHFPKRFNRGLE